MIYFSALSILVASLLPAVDRSVDVLCGPRCLKFTLEWYGSAEPPLRDLVSQLIVSDNASPVGCSLGDLQQLLEKKGVHTKAVSIESTGLLRWANPVIIHLKNSQYVHGHFCVVLPSGDKRFAKVWYPERRDCVFAVAPGVLSESFTGAALLTSRNLITDRDVAEMKSFRGAIPYEYFCTFITASLCWYALLGLKHKKARQT